MELHPKRPRISKVTKDITTSSSVDGRKVGSDSVRQPFTSPTKTVTGTPQTPVSGIGARALQYRQTPAWKESYIGSSGC